jgi:Tol biopolymer transport system component
MSFAISLGPGDAYLTRNVERLAFALSPDGQTVAFVGGAAQQPAPAVMVRRLSSEAVTPIPGTEGASSVFWSPDGKSLGFFAQGKLKRVDLVGGAPFTICSVPRNFGLTGTWGDGQIVFAAVNGQQIMRVPTSGGEPTVIQQPRAAIGELRVLWRSFLPDGRRFLFLSVRGPGEGVVMIGATDGSPLQDVLRARSNAQYAAPGYLVYAREGALLAQTFDPVAGRVSGEPISITSEVHWFVATGLAQFSVSATGAVVFHEGTDTSRIVAFDRIGRENAEIRAVGPYEGLRLFDQGRGLYVDRTDPKTSQMDIWRIDLDRASETRLTSEPAAALNAALLDDGSMIFSTARGGPPTLIRRTPDGKEERLAPDERMQVGSDISPDNRWVLYSHRTDRGDFDLDALQLADKKIVPFHATSADESGARFSPDGRYVAFVSDLGGNYEVYVAPFQGPGPPRIVSTTPGTLPRWSRDGRELFYVGQDGSVFTVPIRTSPSLDIGQPSILFTRGLRYRWLEYEPTADGRFIALVPASVAALQPLHLVLNWMTAAR